jgi:multisubunit Na+/H+ antiporter MnhC subunit
MEEVISKMPQGVEIIQNMPQEFLLFSVSAALVLIAGFYCLIMTYNLIRALIGLEILTKSVTLFIILAGHATGRTGLAQALAITLIVIEVVVIAVAVGIVLCVYKHIKSIDARLLRNIRG